MAHRNHQQGLVYIRRDDVALLREVLRLAYDVVAAVGNGRDKRRPLLVFFDLHMVAHRHGIGRTDAFQAETTLDLGLDNPPAVGLDGVPTSRILDYQTLHRRNIPQLCPYGSKAGERWLIPS